MSETATAAYHRYDISDRAWQTIAPRLLGGPGKVGRPAQDNRCFSNGVIWILRTSAPWRDLPPTTGTEHYPSPLYPLAAGRPLGSSAVRSVRCLDLAWLMIDASNVKVYQYGTGAVSGNQAVGRTKGG